MKQVVLLFWLIGGCLLHPFFATAQLVEWQSADAAVLPPSSSYMASVIDAKGDVYMAGGFTGTGVFGNINLISFGTSVYIAKWRPGVGFLWAKPVSNSYGYSLWVYDIFVRDSSVYLAGSAIGTVTFDNIQVSANQGGGDAIFAKLNQTDSSATWKWAINYGSTDYDFGNSIVAVGNRIYIAGGYKGPVSFGPFTLPGTNSIDLFVGALTETGTTPTLAWIQRAVGTGDELSRSIKVHGNSIYLTGAFNSRTARFGSILLTNSSNNSPSGPAYKDLFVAKLIDGGNRGDWQWVNSVAGIYDEEVQRLCVGNNALYVTGISYSSPAIHFGSLTVNSPKKNAVFVAKIIDTGQGGAWTWVQSVTDSSHKFALDLTAINNNLYVVGGFYAPQATFGAVSLLGTGISGFVAKLADNGLSANWLWAESFNGTGVDYATAVYHDGSQVRLAGVCSSPIRFGSPPLPYVGINAHQFFCATFQDSTLTPPIGSQLPYLLVPNPAHETSTIIGAAPGTRFQILDALGRPVVTATADASGTTRLDVRTLRAGLYLVRSEGRNDTRRLVVE